MALDTLFPATRSCCLKGNFQCLVGKRSSLATITNSYRNSPDLYQSRGPLFGHRANRRDTRPVLAQQQ